MRITSKQLRKMASIVQGIEEMDKAAHRSRSLIEIEQGYRDDVVLKAKERGLSFMIDHKGKVIH